MNLKGRTFITGHRGLVASAIVRRLEQARASNVLTATRRQLWRHRLDQREGLASTYQWFLGHQGPLRASAAAARP